MYDPKPYCRDGESESYIALGILLVWCFVVTLSISLSVLVFV